MTDPTWSRLGASCRPEQRGDDDSPVLDLGPGIEARIADPLWLLARQWQLGELKGEDAASPVQVRTAWHHTRLSHGAPWRPGDDEGSLRPIDPGRLLEPRVERETVTVGPSAFMRAAEAGLYLLRLLDAAGASALRDPLRRAFPLAAPDDPDRTTAAAARRARLYAGRVPDGRAVRTALRDGGAEAGARAGFVPPALRRAVRAVLRRWIRWYDERFDEPAAAADAGLDDDDATVPPSPHWIDERMEYGLQLGAPHGDGGVVLRADGYPGGHLDWSSFDVVEGARPPDGQRTLRRRVDLSLPKPVRYAGMPAHRFWELEPHEVHLGGIEAGPADPARILLAEFATVYGNDWFVVPLAVPVGSLAQVIALQVRDTFGETSTIQPAAQVDGGARVWRWTELDGDPAAGSERGPWLFVPPVVAARQEGAPVERVTLARDEAANVGWAIERVVEGPTGARLDRREVWERANTDGTAADDDGGGEREDRWRYRLETEVPPHFVPLVPVIVGEHGEIELRRGRMRAWDDASLPTGALGRILAPWQARLALREEELPGEGLRITRRWQLARTADGRVQLWMGRRKGPDRGERRSGLRFDVIDRR